MDIVQAGNKGSTVSNQELYREYIADTVNPAVNCGELLYCTGSLHTRENQR